MHEENLEGTRVVAVDSFLNNSNQKSGSERVALQVDTSAFAIKGFRHPAAKANDALKLHYHELFTAIASSTVPVYIQRT